MDDKSKLLVSNWYILNKYGKYNFFNLQLTFNCTIYHSHPPQKNGHLRIVHKNGNIAHSRWHRFSREFIAEGGEFVTKSAVMADFKGDEFRDNFLERVAPCWV